MDGSPHDAVRQQSDLKMQKLNFYHSYIITITYLCKYYSEALTILRYQI